MGQDKTARVSPGASHLVGLTRWAGALLCALTLELCACFGIGSVAKSAVCWGNWAVSAGFGPIQAGDPAGDGPGTAEETGLPTRPAGAPRRTRSLKHITLSCVDLNQLGSDNKPASVHEQIEACGVGFGLVGVLACVWCGGGREVAAGMQGGSAGEQASAAGWFLVSCLGPAIQTNCLDLQCSGARQPPRHRTWLTPAWDGPKPLGAPSVLFPPAAATSLPTETPPPHSLPAPHRTWLRRSGRSNPTSRRTRC